MPNAGVFGSGRTGTSMGLREWMPTIYQGATFMEINWQNSWARWCRTLEGLIYVNARIQVATAGAATTLEVTLPILAKSGQEVCGNYLAVANGTAYQGFWQTDFSSNINAGTYIAKFWQSGAPIPGANAMAASEYVTFSGHYRPGN